MAKYNHEDIEGNFMRLIMFKITGVSKQDIRKMCGAGYMDYDSIRHYVAIGWSLVVSFIVEFTSSYVNYTYGSTSESRFIAGLPMAIGIATIIFLVERTIIFSTMKGWKKFVLRVTLMAFMMFFSSLAVANWKFGTVAEKIIEQEIAQKLDYNCPDVKAKNAALAKSDEALKNLINQFNLEKSKLTESGLAESKGLYTGIKGAGKVFDSLQNDKAQLTASFESQKTILTKELEDAKDLLKAAKAECEKSNAKLSTSIDYSDKAFKAYPIFLSIFSGGKFEFVTRDKSGEFVTDRLDVPWYPVVIVLAAGFLTIIGLLIKIWSGDCAIDQFREETRRKKKQESEDYYA